MLESRLSVTETALDRWQAREVSTVRAWSRNEGVVELTRRLLDIDRSEEALRATAVQSELRSHLGPVIDAYGYQGYFVIAPDGTSLSSTRDANIGTPNLLLADQPAVFAEMLDGAARVTHPQFTDVPVENTVGVLDSDAPTMFVGSPIVDDGVVIAVLTFRLAPEATLANVFTTQRWGTTGEALAVEIDGTLLTPSRFEGLLASAGIVADGGGSRPMILADPGIDLATVSSESVPPFSSWTMTPAAESVLAGETGTSPVGYNSYLGRSVVGAWTWDENLRLGIVVEIDEREALGVVSAGVRTLDAFAAAALAATLMIALLAAHQQRQRREVERLNVSLESAQVNLRQTNEDLAHFAHLAAHDLREPCQRQQRLASLILDAHADELGPDAKDRLGLVVSQSNSMLTMIDGFRSLTNIAGPAICRVPVDLDRTVTALVDELVPPSERPGVFLDLPSAVCVYPELIDLVYRNLIVNATRHGARPLDLRVGATIVDDQLVYTVANTVAAAPRRGGPVDAQLLTEESSTLQSGLGLRICRRVVQHHQGTIVTEQSDDTFTVRFTLEE